MSDKSENQGFEDLRTIQHITDLSFDLKADVLYDPKRNKRYVVLHERRKGSAVACPITVINLDD